MKPITVELPADKPMSARLGILNGRQGHELLTAIDSLKMWEQQTGTWLFPRNRVDDLVAHVAKTRRPVYVIEVDQ